MIRFLALFSLILASGGIFRSVSAQPHELVARPSLKFVKSGFIECSRNEKISCELSAVACFPADGAGSGTIIVASDRPTNDGRNESAIVGRLVNDNWLGQGLLINGKDPAQKIEGLSITRDSKFLIATTAHDRKEPDFQRIIYWAVDELHQVPRQLSVVNENGEGVSLVASLLTKYEEKFGAEYTARTGNKIGYVKIEALTSDPLGRLVFGIRTFGKDFREAQDVVHLISATLRIEADGKLAVDASTLVVESDFSAQVERYFGKTHGITDIVLDRGGGGYWILVSHESGRDGSKKLESRVLYQPIAPLSRDVWSALLVVDGDANSPLELEGKAEGICDLGNGRLMVVYDDDRELTRNGTASARSKLNQARYEIFLRSDRVPRVFPIRQ